MSTTTAAMATVTGRSAALHPVPKPPIREFLVLAPRQILYKRNRTLSFSISYGGNPKQEPPSSSPDFCASSASQTPLAEEEAEEVKESGSSAPPEDGVVLSTLIRDSDSFLSPGACKACGKEVVESGCNGEGRIQGGIATVPGFGWWPIKAYRPCPAFVASGGRYRRTGQSMDEVVSGGGERANAAGINDVAQSSKKKEGSRKSKR
nr:putative E3 ubiquitin-protein ligase MARCH10 [Ipomoea batatas]